MKISGRNSRMSAVILAVVALSVAMPAFASSAFAYEPEEVEFLYLINEYRQSYGLPPLKLNQKLSNASEAYSQLMGQTNCFSHTCNGTTLGDRIRAAGYTYHWAAENIAYGYPTAQRVFTAWKNSAGHNENMLSSGACGIGIGKVDVPGSQIANAWTTDFGDVCGNDPQPPRQDMIPPTVSFAYLTDGSMVSGLVNLTANAWDNVGVTQVDFYVDSQLVASDTTAPYSYEWDVSSPSMPHTVELIAHDAAGYSGSASVQVTVNNFTPTRKYLFNWYDQSSSDWRDWVLMANPAGGQGTARTSVLVGKYTYSDSNIAVAAPAVTPQFPGIMGGPVTVATDQPLIASQRVLYKNSFNEIPGVSETSLESTYYFTWYDSKTENGMKGDWIIIGNQGRDSATVQVYIGGFLQGTYDVPVGDRVTPNYPDVMDGPVKVVCTNGQPLIVSQRVLYKDSFSEVLGVPESKLTNEYNFTWYDSKKANGMKGNWILVGNQDSGDAVVDIYIGGTKMGGYTIGEGERITPTFDNVMSGPVKVVSTNGKRLIVSQRVLFKDSFEEVQGLASSDFGTDLWFTWYDSKAGNGMRGNWILVANTSQQTANVDIYIGGTYMESRQVAAGGEIIPSYYDTMAGPVRVVCTNGVPIMATQRVIYLDSFNEIGGMKR